MELKNVFGEVIFALEGAKTVFELVTAAVAAKKSLNDASLRGANLVDARLVGANLDGASLDGANLDGASLRGASLVGASLVGANLVDASLRGASLVGASLRGANLDGASLVGANLRGASLVGKKIKSMRIFSGLYRYTIHAVLFQDGSRWVRMECLWKSLEDWEKIGIRKSNESEFPDDGSESCEERVAAFEFAKAAALRMKK
jgi:hypothetical protein